MGMNVENNYAFKYAVSTFLPTFQYTNSYFNLLAALQHGICVNVDYLSCKQLRVLWYGTVGFNVPIDTL